MADGRVTERSKTEKKYKVFLYQFIVLLVLIPVAACLLGKWWWSAGILVFLFTSWAGYWLVIAHLLYCFWVWTSVGFTLVHHSTFFLVCSLTSYVFFTSARKAIGKRNADEDIYY